MAVAALLLAGAASCAKDNGPVTEEGAGNVTVKFAFDESAAPESRAVSTAKQTTEWADIQRMMILFVNPGNKVIADARTIAVPTGSATFTPAMFTDVRANSTGWDAYIVANYPTEWTPGNVVGKNLGQLTIEVAPADASFTTSVLNVSGNTAYGEAPEVFVAKQTGVVVAEGTNNTHPNTFKLIRAVSQFRVRIVKDGTQTAQNSTIDFATADAIVAIRRATVTYSMDGLFDYAAVVGTADGVAGANFPATFTPTTPVATNLIYSPGALNSSAPTAGYNNGNTLMADGVAYWKDILVWAGGSKTVNANRFDLFLCGTTTDANYVPAGQTAAVGAGTKVYWAGALNGVMGPNQILEVLVTLNTSGTTTPPTTPGTYGNLEITGELLGWGNIQYVEMPL